jgi:hypothetical protein
MTVSTNLTAGQILTASTVNTFMLNPGLNYVATGTASSGSALLIDGCFTSTFDNYLVLVDNIVTSAGASMRLNLRAAGVVNASNWTYGSITADYTSSTISYGRATTQQVVPFASVGTAVSNQQFEIMSPFATRPSTLYCNAIDSRLTNGVLPFITTGQLANNVSYDGLSLNLSAGTFTSITATVYGYRKA